MNNVDNLKSQDPEAFKSQILAAVKKRQETLKSQDPEAFREKKNKVQQKFGENLKSQDPEAFKSQNLAAVKKRQETLKSQDPGAFKSQNLAAVLKSKAGWTPFRRLKEFRETIKYNAIFICTCCHRRLFKTNVVVLSQTHNGIEEDHYKKCVEADIVTLIDGERNVYLCTTCRDYMKKKKIPPMAATNNLQLTPMEEVQELTELEGALCAKNLIFMKIFQFETSRWTLLSEKVINVPIENSDIGNTIEKLPRTPLQAGLVGVSIRSRLKGSSLKITKHPQRICPTKVLGLISRLKEAGNKYYQNIQNEEEYKEFCEETDVNGYSMLYGTNDDLEEDLECLDTIRKENVEDEIELDAEQVN